MGLPKLFLYSDQNAIQDLEKMTMPAAAPTAAPLMRNKHQISLF
jgi:hypothetical protein